MDRLTACLSLAVLARQGVKRLFLHARRLAFKHPIKGNRIALESPLPEDMLRFCQANFGNVPV